MIIIIFFISSTCEEHTNKAQLQKQDRNIEHIYIIYIIGLVLIFQNLFVYISIFRFESFHSKSGHQHPCCI